MLFRSLFGQLVYVYGVHPREGQAEAVPETGTTVESHDTESQIEEEAKHETEDTQHGPGTHEHGDEERHS